jgi:UDP-glucose 4-epimerase
MKCLVTGGKGFIGSHLVKRLREHNYEVLSIDKNFLVSDLRKDEKFSNRIADIRDYAAMKESMHNVDTVFHLAAESKIGTCVEDPISASSTNDHGTCTLLQAARESGVKRFVYSSTSAAYGLNESPNVETQTNDCLNPYSISKVNGENWCKVYNDLYGLKTIILRYFNVYGEGQPTTGQYAPVMGIFMRQENAGQPLTIVGDGEQRRDFVHVNDVVVANIMAAISNQDDGYYGEVYNVGSGVNYSVNEIAAMISKNTTNIPSRPGECRVTLANCEKIKQAFGWSAKTNLEEWINGKK